MPEEENALRRAQTLVYRCHDFMTLMLACAHVSTCERAHTHMGTDTDTDTQTQTQPEMKKD
jgi:hypothetical protein